MGTTNFDPKEIVNLVLLVVSKTNLTSQWSLVTKKKLDLDSQITTMDKIFRIRW